LCTFVAICFLAFGVWILEQPYTDIFAMMKPRLEQGTSGRCQVYDSSSNSSLFYTAPAAAKCAEGRCAGLKDCVCDKASEADARFDGQCRNAHYEDFEETRWDGDKCLKVRWATANSVSPLQDNNMDPTLSGAAVECPCLDPGSAVVGRDGGKPHADGTALVVMKSGPLKDFVWPAGSKGCTLVHWFRGEPHDTQKLISPKVIGAGKSNSDLHLKDWVNAGELDCIAIPASGEWTADDLMVNANKEGAIEVCNVFMKMSKAYEITAFVVGPLAMLMAIANCVAARKFKVVASRPQA
jgi:hypothetical protein